MPVIAHIELRSDPPQVAGSVVRYVIPPEERGAFSATMALNGESRATLAFPTDSEAWRHVRRMDCLRVVYEDGSSRSWRIADDSLTDDERTGELVLTACEILLDLADVRVLRNESTAGVPQLSRSYAPMTPTEILSDVLRELHEAGEALHIQLGTVQSDALIVHDRTWTTALEVVRAVAAHPQIACEYRLREEPDAYYLDLLQRVGLDAEAVSVRYGGDLGSLVRQRSAAQLATVVIPRGDSADVTCGAAVFEVTEATPDYIRLSDPEAPDAPVIVFDGQFVDAYALRPVDGSLRRIVATRAATQNVYLTGASQFVVGDLVEFRRDLAGNRLVTRTNPAAARARHEGGVGRVERVVPVAAQHAGRNYVKNPFLRAWRLGSDGQVRPVGWTAPGSNRRRMNVPESPSGATALLRPSGILPLAASIPAGATSCSTSHARRARPGETCEIWEGGSKVHTITVTGATATTLTWAEPTPAIITGGQARIVGVHGVVGVNTLRSERIRLADDVLTFSVGALALMPEGAATGTLLTVQVWRYRPGVPGATSLAYWTYPWPGTGVPSEWVTATAEGYAHTSGDSYEVELTLDTAAPFMLGEIAWVYLGEGAEVPAHDLASGQFEVPEWSGGNKLHRMGQAALLQMAPDRASYQLSLADVTAVDGSTVASDRFVLGGPVLLHHDRLDSAVSARLLSITEREDEPDGAELSLDSTEPDVARTLALLLGGRPGVGGTGGVLSGPWPITVEASPSNGGLVSGGGRYVRGQPVEVVALPQPSFVFRRWLEGSTVVADTMRYAFVAKGPRALVAEFQYQPPGSYAITTAVSPAGFGTVTGAGSYAHGASVTVTATPAAGRSFSHWSDGASVVSALAAYTFTALASRDLVAHFVVTPPGNSTITLAVSPVGAGTVTGGGSYVNGDVATVVATPAAGKVFSRWTEGGTAVSASASYAFQVTGARTLTAEFVDAPPGPWTYAASVSPAGTGTVTGAGTYEHGTTVKIVATPATGYRFKRWTESGVGVSIDPTYQVTAAANTTLVAEFEPVPPGPWLIYGTAWPSAYGDVVGNAGPYADGSAVSLTAVPVGARAFLRWTENGVEISTSPTLAFTATGHRALVAEFGAGGGGEDT